MNGEHGESSERQQRLQEVLVAYLEAVESGNAPHQKDFVERHPEFADELADFFAGRQQVDELAAPIREAVQSGDVDEVIAFDTATIGVEKDTADGAAVGTRVRYFGDYELLEEIARGGMGVVYRARQASLNRIVAVKMILAGQLASDEEIQRFHSEAEAAASLDHPGIVPIFEVGEHEGQHYFSMGFVDGQSLAAKLSDGPLPSREAAELTRKVAEAVAYAHEAGVIHRDLKPSNVLLEESRELRAESQEQTKSVVSSTSGSSPLSALSFRPRITDFGLARRVEGDSELTATGQVLGTPTYMSPEQAAAKLGEVKETADIYALGAILYTLLTGRPPFQADNPVDTLMQVMNQEPVSPRLLNPHVPRDLETICLKCLEKDRRRRYVSAEELVDELQRFLNGEPIHARPISSVARAWRWCRRKPVLATTGAIAIVATIATVGTLAVSVVLVTQSRDKAIDLATEKDALATEKDKLAKTERSLREEAEGQLYSHQIASSQRALESDDPVAAARYLDRCGEDLRGWEYHYLYRRATCGARTFSGHAEPVRSVAFSPDGKHIVSGGGGKPGELKVWDAKTGEEIRNLEGHGNYVTSVAFSPDGQRIASGSFEGIIHVWESSTRRRLLRFEFPGHIQGITRPVESLAFSPDGKRIVCGAQSNTPEVFDAHTGERILSLTGSRGDVTHMAFSPDGTRIVGAEARFMRVWNAVTGEEMLSVSEPGGHVLCVAFSPDSQWIVSGSADKTIKIWNASDGQQLRTFEGHTVPVRSVACSPDGAWIVSGGGSLGKRGELKIWDATSGQEIVSLKGHTSIVMSVGFSPDGQHIVSGSWDKTLKVWPTSERRESLTLKGHIGSVATLAFGPEGERIVSAGKDMTVRVWDIRTGEETQTQTFEGHTAQVNSVAFSPDGQRVVSGGGRHGDPGELKVWDVSTGKESLNLAGHTGPVASVAVSPDGKRIVSGGGRRGHPGELKVWDMETGKETLRWNGPIGSVAFSPDGERIVSAGLLDGMVKMWDSTTGQEILAHRGFSNWLITVAFSPDFHRFARRPLTTRDPGALRVWNLDTGEELLTLDGHTDVVCRVAFSPDGKRIVSGGRDQTLKVWDARSGQETLTLAGHSGSVITVAFSPDGNLIASASEDGTVMVWDGTPLPR